MTAVRLLISAISAQYFWTASGFIEALTTHLSDVHPYLSVESKTDQRTITTVRLSQRPVPFR